MKNTSVNASTSRNASVRARTWWALVRSPRALPVLFGSKPEAVANRDPDEYVVHVQVRRATSDVLDIRRVLRPAVSRRIVREFLAGASPRALAKQHGLSYDGICQVLRTGFAR